MGGRGKSPARGAAGTRRAGGLLGGRKDTPAAAPAAAACVQQREAAGSSGKEGVGAGRWTSGLATRPVRLQRLRRCRKGCFAVVRAGHGRGHAQRPQHERERAGDEAAADAYLHDPAPRGKTSLAVCGWVRSICPDQAKARPSHSWCPAGSHGARASPLTSWGPRRRRRARPPMPAHAAPAHRPAGTSPARPQEGCVMRRGVRTGCPHSPGGSCRVGTGDARLTARTRPRSSSSAGFARWAARPPSRLWCAVIGGAACGDLLRNF
jgi:hypothetical protein